MDIIEPRCHFGPEEIQDCQDFFRPFRGDTNKPKKEKEFQEYTRVERLHVENFVTEIGCSATCEYILLLRYYITAGCPKVLP